MTKTFKTIAGLAGLAFALGIFPANADEFTEKDLTEWNAEYMKVVQKGRAAFTDPTLGGSKNGVVCAQCHPNGANTHPETYPKFQKQLGSVVPIREMINWCIRNPLEGQPIELNGKTMVALETYINHERRGVAMAPGKH